MGTSSRPSDLTILSTAATQLFAATAAMDDAAVLSLVMGLREVSHRSLLYGTLQPAGVPVRLFALSRMVEVLQHNRHRLPDLWRVFAAHVGDILTNGSVRPAVRLAAAETLGRAVSALLSTPPAQQHRGGILQPASSVNTECMLLRSLQTLQQDVNEQDAALGILRVCTTVLQHYGAKGRVWLCVMMVVQLPTHVCRRPASRWLGVCAGDAGACSPGQRCRHRARSLSQRAADRQRLCGRHATRAHAARASGCGAVWRAAGRPQHQLDHHHVRCLWGYMAWVSARAPGCCGTLQTPWGERWERGQTRSIP